MKMRSALRFAISMLLISTCATSVNAAMKISAKATSNVTCSAGVCMPSAKKAVLNVNDLATMLASGDVVIKSNRVAQDIEIDAALSWTNARSLTLDSYRNIAFNRLITVAGPGALAIATSDGTSDGDFSFAGKGRVEFWDTTAHLTINGERYTLVKSMQGLIQAAHRSELPIALAKNIDAARHGTYDHAPVPELTHIFEGLGNAISNLTIVNSTSNESLALFQTCAPFPGCSIRDLRLTSVDIQGTGSQQTVAALTELFEAGLIKNVYVTGSVSAIGSGSLAAGLVTVNDGGTILQTHSDVSVSSPNGALVGGLVARQVSSSTIESSYATGTVMGGGGAVVGGLVANIDNGLIQNSYATGSVQGGSAALVGGLVGKNEDDQGPTQLLTSYSTGAVSGGKHATVGGLIGQDMTSGGISDAYWDLDTSGISNRHCGAGNVRNDPGITGLTDAELKSSLPAGFDSSVWAQSPGINNGYPYLLANPPR